MGQPGAHSLPDRDGGHRDRQARRSVLGDWVFGSQVSANFDETVFENPEKFDITRNPNPHLSFGEGIHLCLGRYLARLELACLFPKVLTAFPDMQIAEEPEWIPDNITTGFSKFDVTYTPLVPASV